MKNPCKNCPDSKNRKREWGICNEGFGVCKAYMDYQMKLREERLRGLGMADHAGDFGADGYSDWGYGKN